MLTKGRVYLLIGMPGTGKSSLRAKLANSKFFKKNGILVQDISPDAEGSWIFGKNKKIIKKLRERPKNSYSSLYYQEVYNSLKNAKDNLILFIADFGGLPNSNKENPFSDKEKILETADGYIFLKAENDEWENTLPKKNKHILKYDMPTIKLSEKEFDIFLDKTIVEIEKSLKKMIDYENLYDDYEKRTVKIITDNKMIPINMKNYLCDDLDLIENIIKTAEPLVNLPGKNYCLFGKGPIFLYTHLIKNLSYCSYFEPKSANPTISLPIADRIDYNYDLIDNNSKEKNQNKIIEIKYISEEKRNNDLRNILCLKINLKENFIIPYDMPIINKTEIENYNCSSIYIDGKIPIWGYMDLFLQLKNIVRKRGVYNKQVGKIIWI